MDFRSRIDALPWFEDLDAPVRAALAARGRLRQRAAGEWLWGEGEEDTGIAAVLEGGLHLYAQTPDSGEVLVSLLPRGGVIGQSILFGGGPRLVTAICAVDSIFFVLSDRVLRETAEEFPAIWPALSTLAYAQLREMLSRVVEFVAMTPRERLTARLASLAEFDRRVAVSQSALAEMIGASRNAVNGWLAELEEDGLIARGYGAIEVKSRRALRRRVAARPDERPGA
ncbi:MAG: helix-turn-helix domain-containing protein [Alphaproteobacteria bacterium]|nr:helix-turn-helix domain-containing protein [Alphaproteobacteria bacterium]